MTPLLTALSSCREACTRAVLACSLSPVSAAVRKDRIAVFSELLVLLLRRRAASLVRIRLIWDLMFATKLPRMPIVGKLSETAKSGLVRRTELLARVGRTCRSGQPRQATSALRHRPNHAS